VYAEGGGDRKDVVEADVALSTLKAGHVGSVYTRKLGQLLLGEPARLPKIADSMAETKMLGAYVVIVPFRHGDQYVRMGADYEATDYE